MTGPLGDVVSKFDIRFVQPNKEAMPTGAIHALEHLIATRLHTNFKGKVIDFSPMGCRTGFYLTVFGFWDVSSIGDAIADCLNFVLDATDLPAANPVQCGNYRDLDLRGAQIYARAFAKAFADGEVTYYPSNWPMPTTEYDMVRLRLTNKKNDGA